MLPGPTRSPYQADTISTSTGLPVAIQASALWQQNGWNAMHARGIAAALVVGAGGAGVAEGGAGTGQK